MEGWVAWVLGVTRALFAAILAFFGINLIAPQHPPDTPPSPTLSSSPPSPRSEDVPVTEQPSPVVELNTKKKFDKSFFVRLAPAAKQEKPKGLQVLADIKDRPPVNSPAFGSKFVSNHRSDSRQKHDKRRGGHRQRGKLASDYTGPVAPLEVTENRWVASKTTDLDPCDRVRKEVHTILNKLTPEKFDVLSHQFGSIDIREEGTMAVAVGLIVERAHDNPFFADTYADLAVFLAREWAANNENSSMDFKKQLVNKCQSAFQGRHEPHEFCSEEEAKRARDRSVNNVHFVGKLFCKHMVPQTIVELCLKDLLKTIRTQGSSEEEICALCKMLTTVGSTLEASAAGRGLLDQVMREVQALSNDQMQSRLRFMLMDVVDLRRASWVPRRKVDAPKRLDEIRSESHAQPPALRLAPKFAETRRERRNDSVFSFSLDDRDRNSDSQSDFSQTPDTTPVLGAFKHAAAALAAPSLTLPRSLFTASKISSITSPNNSNTTSTTTAPPAVANGAVNNTPNSEVQVQFKGVVGTAVIDASTLSLSRQSSFSDFDSPMVEPITSPNLSPTFSKKEEQSLKTWMIKLLQGFFTSKSNTAAMEQLPPPFSAWAQVWQAELVYRGVSTSFDRDASDRRNLCLLLKELVLAKLVSPAQVTAGLTRAFDNLEDLSIDVPHCPTFAGHILSTCMTQGVLSVADCVGVLAAILDTSPDMGMQVAGYTFVKYSAKVPSEQVADLFTQLTQSAYQRSDLLSILEQKGLDVSIFTEQS